MAPIRAASLPLLSLLLLLAWPQISFSSTTTATTSNTARSYKEICFTGDDCSSKFNCSQNRCICPTDYFWNSIDCISKSALSVPVLDVGNVTSTTVELTWNPGSAWQGLLDLGVVTWEVLLNSSPRGRISSAETSYTVTGLTKNSYYNVAVRAEILQDGKSHTVNTSQKSFLTLVIPYGGNCSALLLCDDSGLVCEDNRCLCPQGRFRCSSSSCCSVNSATPSVSVSLVGGSSFRVMWSMLTFENWNYITEYQVSWRAQGKASSGNSSVDTSLNYIDVTGLRSATVYDVEVTSIVVDLRRQMSPPGTISQSTKALYVEPCLLPSDCLENGTSYVGCFLNRCVCDSGYFRHSGRCLNVNSYLVPTNFSTEMLTSSTARVSWSVSENHRDAISLYEVYFSINNYVNSSTNTTTENTFTLENLLPGMYHQVRVRSFINRDWRQQYSGAVYWSMNTRPDTPGPMNMTASFVSQDFAFISFETVKVGGQESYHVRLTGPDGEERNLTTQPAHPNVAFSNLIPGQTYQIYITAQYAGLWGNPYVDSITTQAEEASVPVYGAVLLFLLPTLILVVIIIVIVVLIRRGHPLMKCMAPKQRNSNYASARYQGGYENTYCNLQAAPGATSNATTATSSSAESSTTAAAATAAATTTTPHNDYVNHDYVQRGRVARPEEKQHIYANSEVAMGGGGPNKKKALKPKVKGTPTNLGQSGMPQQAHRKVP